MSLEANLIIVLAVLILTLDLKLWSKLERMVNLIAFERQEIIKKIEGILTKIEEIENKLKQAGKDEP